MFGIGSKTSQIWSWNSTVLITYYILDNDIFSVKTCVRLKHRIQKYLHHVLYFLDCFNSVLEKLTDPIYTENHLWTIRFGFSHVAVPRIDSSIELDMNQADNLLHLVHYRSSCIHILINANCSFFFSDIFHP